MGGWEYLLFAAVCAGIAVLFLWLCSGTGGR